MPPNQNNNTGTPQPSVQPVPAQPTVAEPALYVPQPDVAQVSQPAASQQPSKGVNKWVIGGIIGVSLVFFAIVLVVAATAKK